MQEKSLFFIPPQTGIVYFENFHAYSSGTALNATPPNFTLNGVNTPHIQLFNNSGTTNSTYFSGAAVLGGGGLYNVTYSGNASVQARFSSSLGSADPSYGGAAVVLHNPSGYVAGSEGAGYNLTLQRASLAITKMPGYQALGPTFPNFSPANWLDYTLKLERVGNQINGYCDGVLKIITSDSGGYTSGKSGFGVTYDAKSWSTDLTIQTNLPDPKFIASFGHSYVQGNTTTDGNGYRGLFYQQSNLLGPNKWYFTGGVTSGNIPTPYTDGQTGAKAADMLLKIQLNIAGDFPTPTTDDMAFVGPIEYNDAAVPTNLTTFYDTVFSGVSYISNYSPLIKIFIITGGQPPSAVNVLPYAQKVRDVYTALFNAGKNVYLIDWATQASVTDWSNDTIHPSDLGFKQMGSYIFNAVNHILKNY